MKALEYLQHNRLLQTPSTFRLGEITVGVTNSLTPLKMGWVGKRVWLLSNCRYGQKKFCKLKLLDHCIYSFKLNYQKSTCTMIDSALKITLC
jgi:hypothetical protein